MSKLVISLRRVAVTLALLYTVVAASPPSSRLTFSHPLPSLDGNHLQAHIVEVEYGPAGSSTPHSHPCPVIGYVLAGAIRTQTKGQPAAIYRKGESFYEAPNSIHLVSENFSKTESARFLAYFVCDHEAPLSQHVTQHVTQERSIK